MLDRDEILSIAKNAAEEEGWTWLEPVRIMKRRRWLLFGPVEWEVITNIRYRGGNIRVTIDDETGKVVSKGFASR